MILDKNSPMPPVKSEHRGRRGVSDADDEDDDYRRRRDRNNEVKWSVLFSVGGVKIKSELWSRLVSIVWKFCQKADLVNVCECESMSERFTCYFSFILALENKYCVAPPIHSNFLSHYTTRAESNLLGILKAMICLITER